MSGAPGKGGAAGILILSGIDLLLAALTASFGLMLVFSSTAAGKRPGDGNGQGDMASSVIVELSSSRPLDVQCAGARLIGKLQDGAGDYPFDQMLVLKGSARNLQCRVRPSPNPAGGEMRVVLGDGGVLRYRLECAAGTTDLIQLDVRPGRADSARRITGGGCKHTALES